MNLNQICNKMYTIIGNDSNLNIENSNFVFAVASVISITRYRTYVSWQEI